MGIYNTFDYGSGVLYGDASKISYSAAPLTAVAIGNTLLDTQVITDKLSNGTPVYSTKQISYPRVDLSWTNPTGTVYGFRIVRNQEGWSEDEEDGDIILETFNPVIPTQTTITDQYYSVPLQEGHYSYYTVWLLLPDNSWVIGATTYCLIPKEHSVLNPDGTVFKTSTKKFIELFPKVYTTAAKSFLDEVDETSDFYTFFSGFAYTLDEILTYVDLLRPDISGKITNPNIVALQANQIGLPQKSILSIQRQKDLIRNSITINKYRGTIGGIKQFSQSTTGFITSATMSPNLFLNAQNSSFYKSTGSWVVGSGVTLTSNLTTGSSDAPYQGEPYAVDTLYTGKVVTSSTNGYISLGETSPRLKGVPVSPASSYVFSFYVKGTAANVTPSINWYDIFGTLISTSTGTSTTAGSSWSKVTFSVTSPAGALFVSFKITFASIGTYYVDMMQLASSNDFRVNNFYEARAIELSFNPTKVNYFLNPSFNGTSNWTLSGFTSTSNPTTTVPGIFRDGSKMLSATAPTGTSVSLSSTSGGVIDSEKYYTASIYVSTTSGVETINLTLSAYGSDSNILTYSNGVDASASVTNISVNNSWKRIEVVLFVPPTQDSISLKMVISGTGAGNQINFDAAQLEPGYGSTDYFDGSYSSRGAFWLGNSDNSMSVLFRNKSPKIDTIIRFVPEELPLNTPYLITSGISYTAAIPVQTPTTASGTVTLTTSQNHGFSVGQTVVISGVTPSGYNGSFLIAAVPSATSLSYSNSTTGALTVAGSATTLKHFETSGFSS